MVSPDVVTSPVMSPFDQTFAMMSPTLASPVMGSGMMMGGPNQGPHFGPTKQLYNLYTADQGQAYVFIPNLSRDLYQLTDAEFQALRPNGSQSRQGFLPSQRHS